MALTRNVTEHLIYLIITVKTKSSGRELWNRREDDYLLISCIVSWEIFWEFTTSVELLDARSITEGGSHAVKEVINDQRPSHKICAKAFRRKSKRMKFTKRFVFPDLTAVGSSSCSIIVDVSRPRKIWFVCQDINGNGNTMNLITAMINFCRKDCT